MNETGGAPEKAPKQTRADKKRERKLTQAQQIALEKQLVKEGKILPRTRYTPKGYLGRILAVLLAFLFGMLVVIGGLLGGGYYLAVTPSRNLLNLLQLNAEEILTEEYLDKSVIDIVADVQRDVNSLSDPSSLSLQTLSKYTPLIDTYADDLLSQLGEMGVTVEKSELMTTSFSGLGDYLQKTVLPAVELGRAAGLNGESDRLMLALAYGEEGVDFRVTEDGSIEMIGDAAPTTLGDLLDDATGVVERVKLETVLDANAESAALIRALCYGVEGEDYTIDESGNIVMLGDAVPTTLGELMQHPDQIISGITVDSVISIGENSNEALLYLAYGTEGVNYKFENGEVVMLEDPLTGKPYPKRTLDDITQEDLISNATIGSIVSIDENTTGILAAIKDWTIGEDADGDGAIDEGVETIKADRYLSGVWYLLFGGEETNEQGGIVGIVDNTNSPVLEIAGNITEVASKINTLTLWQMWFHEFIDDNPYQTLGFSFEYNGGTYDNLNELTVNGTIALIKNILSGDIPNIGEGTGGTDGN